MRSDGYCGCNKSLHTVGLGLHHHQQLVITLIKAQDSEADRQTDGQTESQRSMPNNITHTKLILDAASLIDECGLQQLSIHCQRSAVQLLLNAHAVR